MVQENKPKGVQPSSPGFASEIEGASILMPGGNDGEDKTIMSGTPAASASVPPPVAAEVAGAPEAGQVVQSATPVVADAGKKPAPNPAEGLTEEQKDDNDVAVDPNAGKKPASNPIDGPTEEQKKDATAGYDAQLAAMQDAMRRYAPETVEERRERERREKASKIVAAISDGIQAVSNLWFTSQYAPNAYNHDKQSMVKSETARFDKLKAERDTNADRYYNYAMQAGNAAAGRAKTLRELEAQHQAQQLARAKAQREEEAQDWKRLLQPDLQREQAGKANKAEQEALSAEYEAWNKPKELELKNATEVARANSYKASAINSHASAAAHNRKDTREYYGLGKNGKEYRFSTRQAAIDFERRQKTYQPWRWGDDVTREVVEMETSEQGKKTLTRNVYPVEDNTPPCRRGNDDKTPPCRRGNDDNRE